jgi:flagellar assembly protein FliH
MEAVKKFAFGQSFIDSSGKVINPEAEQARAEGYESGHEAGYAKAKGEIESDLTAVLAVLNVRLAEISERQQAAYEFVTSSTVSLVKAIAHKIIPQVVAKYGDEEVLVFVTDALKGLKSQGAVTVIVNPALQEAVQAKVKEHLTDKLQISVTTDETLDRSDCKVNWDDGGVEQIRSRLLSEVDFALNRVVQNAPAEPTSEAPIEENQLQGEENV